MMKNLSNKKGLEFDIEKTIEDPKESDSLIENSIETDRDTDYQPARWHLFSLKDFKLGGDKNDRE